MSKPEEQHLAILLYLRSLALGWGELKTVAKIDEWTTVTRKKKIKEAVEETTTKTSCPSA